MAHVVLFAVGGGADWTMPWPWSSSMRRGARADREFESFFSAHYDAVVRSIAAMTGDREQAIDAAQEAFIRAYARWRHVRRYDNPGAWVRRIAINVSRDLHRSDQRRSRREQRHAAPFTTGLDDDTGGRSALHLLEDLPEQQRNVAALYYLDDLSVADVAKVLSIAPGTVRFHLNQARDRLRSRLDNDEERRRVVR